MFRSRQSSRMITALLCSSSRVEAQISVIYNFLGPGEADYHAV